MIEKRKTKMGRGSKNKILQEMSEEFPNIKNFTADEVLEHLLEEYDGRNVSKYTLYKYNVKVEKTLFNRINMCWIYPLFFISIPLQWVIRGEVGINSNTNFGKFINKLTRYDV